MKPGSKILLASSGDPRVFIILILVFLAVGIHLFLWSRKRNKMIREFYQKKGMKLCEGEESVLEKKLNEAFGLEELNGQYRLFSSVRNIATDGTITFFSFTEYCRNFAGIGQKGTSHPFIGATFSAAVDKNICFYRNHDGECKTDYISGENSEEDFALSTVRKLLQAEPPDPSNWGIRVSFAPGVILLYLRPGVVGCEKEEDLDYMYKIGKKIRAEIETCSA
ncbi:hypothetical protein ACFL35_03535 [Candidatus Riflebacteria bacterium]